jgi:hypothetical protein
LHSYAYNGIYEGLTPSKKYDVMDILSFTHFILDSSKNYFKEIWNEEHEKELENVKKLLEEIERNKSS